MDSNLNSHKPKNFFLSHEEANQLQRNFKNTINEMKKEKDSLMPKLEDARSHLKSLKATKDKLEQEMTVFKQKNEKLQPLIQTILEHQKGCYASDKSINEMYRQLSINEIIGETDMGTNHQVIKQESKSEHEQNETQEKVELNQFQSLVEKINVEIKDQKIKLDLQEAVKMMGSELKQKHKNTSKFKQLLTASLVNRERILAKVSPLLAIQFCMRCKQRFSPLDNTEGSCVHHIGKLKFYSCRSCGCDEYYNCCGKCLKCSKGCASSKHAAPEKIYRSDSSIPQQKPASTSSLQDIASSEFYSLSFQDLHFIGSFQ